MWLRAGGKLTLQNFLPLETGRDCEGLRWGTMNVKGRIVREKYVLSVDQVAAALTDTVLRAQIEAAEDPAQRGALGALLRVDRVFDRMELWFLRLVFAGIPLALGVYLLVVAGSPVFGVLAIVASPIVLLLVLGVERVLFRLNRAFYAATDPMIAKSGGRRLKAAIEEERVNVLRGTVEAELAGDQLLTRAGQRTVTIPSVRTAWRAWSSSHLVLAESPPGPRPDFAKYVLLPADGAVAAAIAER
jgi:hypothetical protein